MRVDSLNMIYSQPQIKSLNKKQNKNDSSPVYQYNLKADQVSFRNNKPSKAEMEQIISDSVQLVRSKINIDKVEKNIKPETHILKHGRRNEEEFAKMWDRVYEASENK